MVRLLIIPAVLLALLVGAMTWSGASRRDPPEFTFINRGDVRTLDPNRLSWTEDIRLGYALYEGLYTLDPATLSAIPGAASRHDLSPDKTVYTFHIRPNARWSNGDPVRSADFVFSWRRMLEQPGDYTYLFDCIRGAAAYRAAIAQNRPADFTTVGITPLDDKTLRISLEHPVTYFLDLVAFPAFFPMNQRSLAPFEVRNPDTNRLTYRGEFMRPPHLVGNGPFRLDRWLFKQRVRLVANDAYWDRPSVRSRVIDIVIVQDNRLGEFLRYDRGQVDLLPDVDADIAAELLAAGRADPAHRRADLHIYPGFGTYFYTFNCEPTLKTGQPNPFADPRIRRAFAMALDPQPIVDTVLRTGERPARHFIPPGIFPGYDSPPGIRRDPAEALRLLAAAGYPDGRGFPRIQLTLNTGSGHENVAQVARRQWQTHLNVNIDLEAVESSIFSERLRNQEYSIARASWFGDYGDVSTFTDRFLSASDNNDCRWLNPKYDALCASAARESDPARRMALLRDAEQLLLDEAPIIPVYYYVNRLMYRDNVRGLARTPRHTIMLKAVEKVRR